MRLISIDETTIEPNAEPAPEDAWLNDTGLSQQTQPKINHQQQTILEKETVGPTSEVETYSLIDYAELLAQQDTPTLTMQAVPPTPEETPIEPNHRHRPLVRHLSERIWQELHRKPGAADALEPALIEFVRNRSLDALRGESEIDLSEAEQLSHNIVDEVLGYGPLEAFIGNEDISEITVAGPHLTYIVRNGKLQEIPSCFEDERHMLRIIENILRYAEQRVELNGPIAHLRLRNGTTVSIVMPPYAIQGPTITIRKSTNQLLSLPDLVQLGSITQPMADFLTACIQARLNIVICGGTGSGRTVLLNALGACIPPEHRIVTIEDVAELQLIHKQVIALESRLTDHNSTKHITTRDLVLHALHIHPDHLIIGECRGSEVEELLQAMYSGFSGVLTTIYAQNLRDCLTRLEVMSLAGGQHLPTSTIRAQIAGSLDLIIYIARLRDSSHKIMNIAEIQGLENDSIRLQNIFHYQETELETTTGKVQGIFKSGGFRPHCLTKLEAAHIHLPREIFAPKYR